jgi:hypothetical protein
MSNEEGTRSSAVAARVGIGIGIAIGIENKLESPTLTSILRWNHPAMVESLWMTPCPVIRSRPGCRLKRLTATASLDPSDRACSTHYESIPQETPHDSTP